MSHSLRTFLITHSINMSRKNVHSPATPQTQRLLWSQSGASIPYTRSTRLERHSAIVFYTDCLPRHVIDNFYSPNDNYVIFTHTDKKALQCRIFLRSASSERRMSLETDCVIDCQGHPRSLKAHTQLPISDQHQL